MTYLKTSSLESSLSDLHTGAELSSLSELWAKKYIAKLKVQDNLLTELGNAQLRDDVAQSLIGMLRSVSAQAWSRTESLLSHEILRHQIDMDLIDPWAIAKDVYQIFRKALTAYKNCVSPQRLSVLITADLGAIRQKYTSIDPRVLGFVSMQFHYCGQLLAQQVTRQTQRSLLEAYFKVIDDHLYMPLQRAYNAAATYHYDDPHLAAVQALLPHSSKIAAEIVNTVHQAHPTYTVHTGRLNSEAVRISSIRDVEMFQVYIWTCVLERNIAAIKQELFPLCVMLYPTLKVRWELVREMLSLLHHSFLSYGHSRHQPYYQPYHDALCNMFSERVLG